MENKQKDSSIKNIAGYSSSKLYQRIVGIGNAFIRPKLLTPELYGLWNILNIIPTYASYVHLGSRDLMRFLIPYNEARNELQKNSAIERNTFYGSLYLNILITVVVLIIFLVKGGLSFESRIGLLTMAFVVIITWYYEHYMCLLKAYQNFKLISSSNYLYSTCSLLLSIMFIYWLGIYGLYISAILSLMIVILYLKANYSVAPNTKFSFELFADLVKNGFPIMMFDFITILIRSSDRIIVSYFLGNEQVGYYAISTMIMSALLNIPSAAREVMEPRLMENLHNNSPENNLKEYFFKPLINTAYYMPFMIGPAIFVSPLFIHILLPKYTPSILPTQIIIVGVYFLGMFYTFRGIVVANNWQLKASLVMIFSLLINISLCVFFVKLGLGLGGVALGSSISFLVLFISLLIFIRIGYDHTIQDWGKYLKGLWWPFLIMGGAIVFLKYISEALHINSFLAAFINTSLFCLIMFIVIKIAQKRHFLLRGIGPKF